VTQRSWKANLGTTSVRKTLNVLAEGFVPAKEGSTSGPADLLVSLIIFKYHFPYTYEVVKHTKVKYNFVLAFN
jgi:hypothetical protein